MGVVVRLSHLVSAAPFSSQGGLLIVFPCSGVASRPQDTVLFELLRWESFSWSCSSSHECVSRDVTLSQFSCRTVASSPSWLLPTLWTLVWMQFCRAIDPVAFFYCGGDPNSVAVLRLFCGFKHIYILCFFAAVWISIPCLHWSGRVKDLSRLPSLKH